MDRPIPRQRQWAGRCQPARERGHKDGIPYQTANRLPVSNQDFLGFCMVDIRPEGCSQEISSPEETHMAHTLEIGKPWKLSGWDGEVIRSTASGESALTKHLVA